MASAAQSRDGSLTITGVNSVTKPAPPVFPLPGHRTLAQIDAQERMAARNEARAMLYRRRAA